MLCSREASGVLNQVLRVRIRFQTGDRWGAAAGREAAHCATARAPAGDLPGNGGEPSIACSVGLGPLRRTEPAEHSALPFEAVSGLGICWGLAGDRGSLRPQSAPADAPFAQTPPDRRDFGGSVRACGWSGAVLKTEPVEHVLSRPARDRRTEADTDLAPPHVGAPAAGRVPRRALARPVKPAAGRCGRTAAARFDARTLRLQRKARYEERNADQRPPAGGKSHRRH